MTLPETNIIAPENGWLEDDFPWFSPIFRGEIRSFQGVFSWNQHKIKNKTNPNPYQFKLWFPKINTFDGLCFFCSYLKPKKIEQINNKLKKNTSPSLNPAWSMVRCLCMFFFGSSSSFYLNWNAIFYKWQVDFIFFKICFKCVPLSFRVYICIAVFFRQKSQSRPESQFGSHTGCFDGNTGEISATEKKAKLY